MAESQKKARAHKAVLEAGLLAGIHLKAQEAFHWVGWVRPTKKERFRKGWGLGWRQDASFGH